MDKQDIQDAIDVANGIDPVVVVTNGVYTNGTTTIGSGVPNRIAITNDILVISVNGADDTIIAGEGPVGALAVRCAYVGSNACLQGFTLTNGYTYAYLFDITNGSGGGVWCETGARVEDCRIMNNEAFFAGGGVYGEGTVKRCIVNDNSAYLGGGVCDSFAEETIISDNNATIGGGFAWWISWISRSRNCLIVSNTATSAGGVYGGLVENCTVADNIATNGGGVDSCTVRNSIVYLNTPDNGTNSSFSYSCTTPVPLYGDGNISTWPGFVNETNGNYHLLENSACVDRGEPAIWMLASKDLEGNERIDGYQVDIGCYERDSGYNKITDIIIPHIGTNYLEISDDGYTHTGPNARHTGNGYELIGTNTPMKIDIGFIINFFGTEYTNLFVNNNGNMTFDSELSDFIPELLDGKKVIISPFWADIDTRNLPGIDGPVLYGQSNIYQYACFGVTWTNTGYFNTKGDKTNDLQAILIERSDITNGDFDLEYNFRRIQWETGDLSYGTNGFGGYSARVGFGDDNGFGFELPGSGVPGSFLSGGENDLTNNYLNSVVPGRYIFHFRNGWPLDTLYEATMTTDPGWTLEGDWTYGTPAGHDGDPSGGYKSQPHVIGYNLNGAYSNNLGKIAATVSSIDCSHAVNNVFLSFQRWLTVKTNDFASIEVSSDGNNWVEVWNSNTNAYNDTKWTHVMVDLSPVAAGQNDVSIRWIMGTTDDQDVAGGWNLDEVRVLYVW